MARIFHLATADDWRAAQASGRYTTSTRGRTLAEEGFIHASRADQWPAVRERFYADVTEPLLLLVIDTDLLDVPVVEEEVPGTGETYPHVYGPLRTQAVVQALPVDVALGGPSPSFSSLFLGEVLRNALLGSLLLVLVVAGVLVGSTLGGAVGAWLGLAAGVGLGVAAITLVNRRRG